MGVAGSNPSIAIYGPGRIIECSAERERAEQEWGAMMDSSFEEVLYGLTIISLWDSSR